MTTADRWEAEERRRLIGEEHLPNPEEPGISVEERVRRIGMEGNHWLHPDYTDRELRMLADLASLVGFVRDVVVILKRHGVTYPLMPGMVKRVESEYGPWMAD